MNVILKVPIRTSATETLPADKIVPAAVFGKSLDYLLERGCVAVVQEKAVQPPEPPKDPEPAPEPPKPTMPPPAEQKRR